MRDKLKLTITDDSARATALEDFRAYEIDADLYQAADAWSISPRAGLAVADFARVQLSVNGQLALTGVVDSVERECSKEGRTVKLSGRDLMGLVVDQYAEQFNFEPKITLPVLAQTLLTSVPLINVKGITYEAADPVHQEELLAIASPGQKVFDVLKAFASARGLLFYALPSGQFVFGRPRSTGAPRFKITFNRSCAANNALTGKVLQNFAARYKKIVVHGLLQGQDEAESQQKTEAAAGSSTAYKTDSEVKQTVVLKDVPLNRVYVEHENNGAIEVRHRANMIASRQRFESYKLTYTVPGHSQAGRVWDINELCEVEDDINGVKKGAYLIYGRTFRLDKDNGPTTELRLGYPGVVL
ncbi:MAG: hypothetical protein GX410_01555 [Elusimicrobia bacterium]|nr:hypothetical protein [Elusimicrobiota bacterium]